MKPDNQTHFASSAKMPASNEQTFSISELAKEFDITTRSIRFYEDQGLITPERNGQTRIYSKRDKVRLKLVIHLIDLRCRDNDALRLLIPSRQL